MPLIPAEELPHGVLAVLRTRDSWPVETGRRFPAATRPLETAESVLAGRRAVRLFTGEPVAARDVAKIAEHARRAERAVWPAPAHGVIGYTILVAAFRITGLAPGLYLVSEDSSEPFSALPTVPCLESLRTAYSDAAFLLLVCADIAAACQHGAPGYGPLLIRAGTLGHGAWLGAISLGLAGCVYAGPHHLVTEAVRLLDGRSNHIFTTSLGWAHRPAASCAYGTPDEEAR